MDFETRLGEGPNGAPRAFGAGGSLRPLANPIETEARSGEPPVARRVVGRPGISVSPRGLPVDDSVSAGSGTRLRSFAWQRPARGFGWLEAMARQLL